MLNFPLSNLQGALYARYASISAEGWWVALRHARFALFIAAILAYGAAFAWYMLAHFDLLNLIRDVSNDDAFYYFQIARNLADGKFSTFDGGITQTNGYHPLWLFLITPFYWIFDKEAALFGIKAFEIMLIAGGVALIAAAARLARLPWILLFATLPLLYQYRALLLGLEAAAALFMLGLLSLALMLYARNPARWQCPLAVVAFALPWARLEYIVISLAATAALCLMECSWPSRPPSPATWRDRVRCWYTHCAIIPFLGAVAGILVYFAYNGLAFGGIVPVSGATKQAWSQLHWETEGGYSLAQNLQEVRQIYIFNNELLVALVICACFPAVWWLARRSRNEQDRLLLVFLVSVFGLAAGHVAKFAQTALTVHPHWGNDGWYFVPAYLMMALVVPASCYAAIYLIRRCIGPKWRRTANLLSAAVVIAGAAFLLAKTDFTEPFRFVDQVSERSHREWEVASYSGVLIANRVLSDDSVIGSWDAGVIGYFSRFPVVNLDGLVNSYDYFHATGGRNRCYSGRGELGPCEEFGITHLANAVNGIYSIFFDNALVTGAPFPSGSKELQFKIWPAPRSETAPDQFDNIAHFWKRMEPYFDYQLGNLGIIVDGRLAQAFYRDCDPDNLLVLSSGSQSADATIAPWHPWPETPQGTRPFCVASLILPHNVAPQLHAATMRVSELAGDTPPAIRSNFDVYFNNNRLIYLKQQCQPADTAATFFLHLDPVDRDDLPAHRKQYNFDNFDFLFTQYGGQYGAACFAVRDLPDYDIAAIRTGQYVRTKDGFNRLWEGEYRPGRTIPP